MSSMTTAGALDQAAARAKRNRFTVGRVVLYLLAIFLGFLFALPFLWMLSTAFKSRAELNLFPPSVTPIHWTPGNFAKIWHVQPFARFLVNSFVYAGGAVIGTVLSSTLVAYGFARLKFWGRDFWFIVMLATLMLPSQVLVHPAIHLVPRSRLAQFAQAARRADLLRQPFLYLPHPPVPAHPAHLPR